MKIVFVLIIGLIFTCQASERRLFDRCEIEDSSEEAVIKQKLSNAQNSEPHFIVPSIQHKILKYPIEHSVVINCDDREEIWYHELKVVGEKSSKPLSNDQESSIDFKFSSLLSEKRTSLLEQTKPIHVLKNPNGLERLVCLDRASNRWKMLAQEYKSCSLKSDKVLLKKNNLKKMAHHLKQPMKR